MVGVQFTIATNAYTDDDSLESERVIVELAGIGQLLADCETIDLTGELDRI